MEDNILLAQELIIDLNKRHKEPNLILKLGIEKVYDTLGWSFLMKMMQAFGFGNCFVTNLIIGF